MTKWLLTITPRKAGDVLPGLRRLNRRLLKFSGLSFVHRQLLRQQLPRTACIGATVYRKGRQTLKLYDFYWRGEVEIKASKKPEPEQQGGLWAKSMQWQSLSGGGLWVGQPLQELKFPRGMEAEEQLRLEAMIEEACGSGLCHRRLEEEGWKFDGQRIWIVGKVEVKKSEEGGTP